MSFRIKPGKVACAGFVGIIMVLPNSIWKGPDAKVAPRPKPRIEAFKKASRSDAARVKFRKMPR